MEGGEGWGAKRGKGGEALGWRAGGWGPKFRVFFFPLPTLFLFFFPLISQDFRGIAVVSARFHH